MEPMRLGSVRPFFGVVKFRLTRFVYFWQEPPSATRMCHPRGATTIFATMATGQRRPSDATLFRSRFKFSVYNSLDKVRAH
jgi:hypothetical protein